MIDVALCEDESLIRRVATHKRVWPWIIDDYVFDFEFDPNQLYLSINDKGFVAMQKMNEACTQIHIALLPELWGKGVEIGAAVKEWIFTHTLCLKIVAIVPVDNRLALKLAEQCGMREEGRIRESFQRGFKLFDQIVFGIEKGT